MYGLWLESATHSERAGGARRARNSQRWVAAACMKTRGTRRRRPRWVLAARAGRLAPVYSTTPHTPPVYITPPVFILFTHLDFGENSPLSLSVPLEVGPSPACPFFLPLRSRPPLWLWGVREHIRSLGWARQANDFGAFMHKFAPFWLLHNE